MTQGDISDRSQESIEEDAINDVECSRSYDIRRSKNIQLVLSIWSKQCYKHANCSYQTMWHQQRNLVLTFCEPLKFMSTYFSVKFPFQPDYSSHCPSALHSPFSIPWLSHFPRMDTPFFPYAPSSLYSSFKTQLKSSIKHSLAIPIHSDLCLL